MHVRLACRHRETIHMRFVDPILLYHCCYYPCIRTSCCVVAVHSSSVGAWAAPGCCRSLAKKPDFSVFVNSSGGSQTLGARHAHQRCCASPIRSGKMYGRVLCVPRRRNREKNSIPAEIYKKKKTKIGNGTKLVIFAR